jgi:short-subunit dehydrogenase
MNPIRCTAISCDVPKRRLYDISVNVQIDYLSGHGRGHSARKEDSIMASIEHKGTALITGASSGIGAVYADRLARQGYDLILVARNRDRLQELASRLTTETGRSVEIVTADLGSPADLARVEAALRTDASITMLVNNAGFGATAPLLGLDIARMDEMIALNVGALTRLTYAAAPGFVARGGGTIVNIASIVAISPETLNGVYGGSKAFVLAFSQSLHQSLPTKACAFRRCCRARPRQNSGASPACRFTTCPPRS